MTATDHMLSMLQKHLASQGASTDETGQITYRVEIFDVRQRWVSQVQGEML